MLSRNPFSFPQTYVFPFSHPLFHFGHAVSEALLKPLAAVHAAVAVVATANDDLQISDNLFMCAIRCPLKIPNTR